MRGWYAVSLHFTPGTLAIRRRAAGHRTERSITRLPLPLAVDLLQLAFVCYDMSGIQFGTRTKAENTFF